MSKAIIVDGCSLSYMRQPLGLRSYRFVELFQFLSSLGSETEIWNKPIYVANQMLANRIGTAVSFAGFDFVLRDGHGKDDEYIIELIESLPEEVVDVILVSADSDFIEVLQGRVLMGNQVTIVATNKPCNDGVVMVGYQLRDRFNSETFKFVELADYSGRIGYEWERFPPDAVRTAGSAVMGDLSSFDMLRTCGRVVMEEAHLPALIPPAVVTEVVPPTQAESVVQTVMVQQTPVTPTVKLHIELDAVGNSEEAGAIILSVMGIIAKYPMIGFKISN